MAILLADDAVYDVAAYSFSSVPDESGEVLSGRDVELVTGLQKVGQRFVMEFTTELGSITYQPSRGCTFMATARQGQLRTELDVFEEYSVSAKKCQENLQAEEDDTWADDDRFDRAVLSQLAIDGNLITMRIRVYNRSQQALNLSLSLNIRF